MKTIKVELTESQCAMLDRLCQHHQDELASVLKEPYTSPAAMLRMLLHAEHHERFGEDEHNRVLGWTDEVGA